MDTKSYKIVLADLEQEIESKRNKANELLNEIEQIENAISVLQTKMENDESLSDSGVDINKISSPQIIEAGKNDGELVDEESKLLTQNEYTKENQSKISLNNGCEKILEKEGKPLYIIELIEKLKEYGRFTNRKQLSGTIRRDNKDRFVNLGGNTWDLKNRHQSNED